MVSTTPKTQSFYSYVACDGLGIILKAKCGISVSQGLRVCFSGQRHLRKGLPKKICQKDLLKHPYKTVDTSNVCPVAKHFVCDSIFRSLLPLQVVLRSIGSILAV